jgi:FtsH-binding integral membrane protein
VLLGLLLNQYFLNKWIQRTRRLKHPFMRVISSSLKGIIIVLTFLIGLDLAVNDLPIKAELLVHINKGMVVLFIITLTVWCARIITGMIKVYGRRKKTPALTLFTNLTKIIVYIIGFLIISNPWVSDRPL